MTVQNTELNDALSFVGRIEAARSIDLAFEVSGPLSRLPVLEGQTVETGTLVAGLDAQDFQLAVAEAEVQLRLAGQDLERKQRVLQQRGIAKSVVDDARTNYELQRVRLAQAREKLADTELRAPFAAFVARRYVDNFVNIRAGEPVVRLHDLHQLLVVANVPERLLATLDQDDVRQMYCQFDFAPGKRFALTYQENRGEADPVAQTYEVTFAMPRPDDVNLLPGMTASVTIELVEQVTQSIVLPYTAVAGSKDQFFAWVVDPTLNTVARREISVGEPLGRGLPVLAGLQSGELVVLKGIQGLREGMQIRPIAVSE